MIARVKILCFIVLFLSGQLITCFTFALRVNRANQVVTKDFARFNSDSQLIQKSVNLGRIAVYRRQTALKDILGPKTFKEGMEEGSESVQVSKMKAIAAEKRRMRDEKLAEEESSNADVEKKESE